MRKLSSKIVAAILAGTMVLGTIGCGNTTTSKEESKVTSESKKEESKTSESSESKAEEVVEEVLPGAGEVVYPLEGNETISVWNTTQKPPAIYKDETEHPFLVGLADRIGVELDWQYPAEGANSTEAYNLMMTQKVLPDIITGWISAGDAQTMMEEGTIYDLTEYLPKYAPDYWKLITDMGAEKDIVTDDGKLYGVHCISSEFIATYIGPIIRMDWLEECGLEAPVTLEDWEEVLVAFKDKYDATFSFVLSNMGDTGINSGTGAYGSIKSPGNGYYIDDNGKIQYPFVEPAYKEYLETLNRWYEMDLIDKDFTTIDNAILRTKVLNGEVGVTFGPMSQLTNYISDAEAQGNGADWQGFSYPRTAPGEPTCWINTVASDITGWCAVVSTSCPEEKLITALRFLNYGYTEEGREYVNFGEEGTVWTKDANGKHQWTELITSDPDGLNNAVKKYSAGHGNYMYARMDEYVQLKNVPECTDAVYTWIENSEARSHYYPTTAAKTPDEQSEFADLDNALTTNQNEMALKFITGEVDFDKWDEYVATQEQLGYKRTVEIQQAAYDRYLNK